MLISRTCSDGHTCLVPNDQLSEKSLIPVVSQGNLLAETRTELARSGFAHGHGRRHGRGHGKIGHDVGIPCYTTGIKLSSLYDFWNI